MRQTEIFQAKFLWKKKYKAFKSQLTYQEEMIQEEFDCESAHYAKQVQSAVDKLMSQRKRKK